MVQKPSTTGLEVADLLRALVRPVVIGATALCLVTFLAEIDPPEPRWEFRHWIYDLFELRAEGNVGTWFESVLFLLCALAAADLGWRRDAMLQSGRWDTWLFRLIALGCVFLSLDEAAMVHETIGMKFESKTGLLEGQAIDGVGFSWVLIYSLPVLVGVVLTRRVMQRSLGAGPQTRGLRTALTTITLAPLAVLVLEACEGMLWAQGQTHSFLTCFEETFEIASLLAFLALAAAAAGRIAARANGVGESILVESSARDAGDGHTPHPAMNRATAARSSADGRHQSPR